MTMKDDVTSILVKVGKIEEHLSGINGRIDKHDDNIDELYGKVHDVKTDTIRNTTKMAIFSSIIVGTIIGFIVYLLP